jgi:hypothetical protein
MMAHPEVEHELQHGEHPHAYDRRDPNYKILLPFSLISFLIFVVIVMGVTQYYEIFRDDMIQERVLAPESRELKALRALEEQQLTSYGSVDKEKGLVRIPIDRAMELVAADAAAGKPKYNTNPYSVKSAVAAPAAVPAAGGPAGK